MQCEICHEKPATVHLTQVVDGNVKKLHLCSGCAEQSGIDLQGPVSIADLLLGLGTPGAEEEKDAGGSCPHCHLKMSDFKKTGRLGCPRCYESFARDLGGLVRAMHRHEQHHGKIPRDREAHLRAAAEQAQLQRELDRAVAAERFEEAAALRDRLRALRAGDGEPGKTAGGETP